MSAPRTSVDHAIREAVRDVVREVVRDEVRLAIREELAHLRAAPVARDIDYVSVSVAATIAQVHAATIRAWMDQGKLPSFRAGRHRRVKRADLERFMSNLGCEKEADLDRRANELAAA